VSSWRDREEPTLDEIEAWLRGHGIGDDHVRDVRRVLAERGAGGRAVVAVAARAEAPPARALQSDLATVAVSELGVLATSASAPPSDLPTVALAAGAAAERVPGLSARAAPADASAEGRASPGQLETGALIAAGGMGEVYRVKDFALHRPLAMKVLLASLRDEPHMRDRFVDEAQVTAQLGHPGVVPVHAIGELPDGRPFFTMKEVRGLTLADAIGEWRRGGAGAARWSEQRRLEIFQKVCEAVAYAHARGVAHCDLKPANVMVGAFGEVLVMDWGVARLVAPSMSGDDTGEPPVMTVGVVTANAWVAGTPEYMAPEQARADLARLGPPADVFALGVMLYELLAGERPYHGSPTELRAQAEAFALPPLPAAAAGAGDEALFAIIARALAPDPAARYPDAKALADDLGRWREGALRREKGLAVVREAEALLPEIAEHAARVASLREAAARELAAIAPDAPSAYRAHAWALEDEARELTNEVALRTMQAEQRLHAALTHAPDLVEAKRLIASLRRERHREAERRRDFAEAARHELVLRTFDVGEHQGYLDGLAPLTLVTDPPCRVRLSRFVVRQRQLVPMFVRELGETPLVDVELPVGSYLLELDAGDRPTVRYPVWLRRAGAFTGRRPGEASPAVIRLPPAGALAPGEAWIAEGPFQRGGDDDAPGAGPAEDVWVAGFAIDERPVTNAELARFLAALEGTPYRRGVLRDGLAVLAPDAPAVGLSWEGAAALARWRSRTTGRRYRLPTEHEWEKAARGADGRLYPWGDFTDGSLCCSRTAERAPRGPALVTAFPSDVSPYGVRGVGGNVRDWCADAPGPEGAHGGARHEGERVVRGGSWRQPPDAARVAARASLAEGVGHVDVGVRLVRGI
jgi:serine/threonine-protein kinase